MGMGLILGGIGKGIADAGAAYAGGMMKGAEFEMQQQRDEDRERRAEERKTRTEEALKQRVIAESEQVQQRAAEAPARRVAGEIDKYGSMVAGESPEMSKEEIQKLVQDNPQYKAIYEKAGLIGADKMDPRLRASSDRAEAALAIGAHSSVIEAYSKERDSVLKEIKEENAVKRSEAAEERRSKEFQALLPIRQQTADAATTKANKPAGGGGGGEKPITGVDLERTAKAAEKSLALHLGVPTKDVPETVARLKKQNKIDSATQTKLDEYNSTLSEWQNYRKKPKAAGDNAASAGGADYSNLWK